MIEKPMMKAHINTRLFIECFFGFIGSLDNKGMKANVKTWMVCEEVINP
ncbi:hypothetical protein GCM10009123_07380 [Kangiella japonica]|uniref:Transposase DDE domain-containing protein n=1 Tax=Kangiella japonica TaxID=647384 RepID=A0ABN0SVN1_9GAMM